MYLGRTRSFREGKFHSPSEDLMPSSLLIQMSTYLALLLLWLPPTLYATSTFEIHKRSAVWHGTISSGAPNKDDAVFIGGTMETHDGGTSNVNDNHNENDLHDHPDGMGDSSLANDIYDSNNHHVIIADNGIIFNSGNNTSTNVTVQLGATAFLHCHVRHSDRTITGSEISWIRRRDWHILSSGMFVYTNDERFQILHAEGSDDWTLQIKYVQKRDNGTYECQLATGTGIVSLFVNLQIVVPEAFILGSSERHVDAGSIIRLVCVIEKSPTPPQYVFWYHNERMINYDMSRGGISVETEPGPQTQSRLMIRDARDSDSGNYTCTASNTEPASIHVYVSQGDKMAATLRRIPQGIAVRHLTHNFYILLILSLAIFR